MTHHCRKITTLLGIVAVGSALVLIATCSDPGPTKPQTPPESLYTPGG